MLKTVLKRAGSVLFGLLVALLAAEIALRVMVARNIWPNRAAIDLFVPHPIGWTLQPDAQAKIPSLNGVIAVEVNSVGYRDRDYPVERSQGTSRLLVLADSFGAALETPQEETFHVKLEDHYNGSVEVISMSASVYNLAQEFLVYQHIGREYDPDVVLLVLYTGNDIISTRGFTGLPRYTMSESGTLTLIDFPFAKVDSIAELEGFASLQPSTPLMRRSRLAFLVGLALRQQEDPLPEDAACSQLNLENFPAPTAKDWEVSEAILLAMRDAVETDGALLKIALIPMEFQIEPAFQEEPLASCPQPDWAIDAPPQVRLTAFLDENDIDYLDLTPVLRSARQSTDTHLYLPNDDIHWTSAAHAIVADTIYQWLDFE